MRNPTGNLEATMNEPNYESSSSDEEDFVPSNLLASLNSMEGVQPGMTSFQMPGCDPPNESTPLNTNTYDGNLVYFRDS